MTTEITVKRRLLEIQDELDALPPKDRSTLQGRKQDNRRSLLYRQRKQYFIKLAEIRRTQH